MKVEFINGNIIVSNVSGVSAEVISGMVKTEIEKNSIFAKLESAKNKACSDKIVRETKLYNEFQMEYHKALKFMSKVEYLCEIVNKAMECGYVVVSTHSMMTMDGKVAELETDGIGHRLGFYGKHMVGINRIDFGCKHMYIGYQNGGCFGNNDLFTDGKDVYYGTLKGNVSLSTYPNVPNFAAFSKDRFWKCALRDLKYFNSGFQDFYDKVMDFVNNIDKYTNYKYK